jgi:dTDP-glucose pyrophosphorylase
MGKHLELCRVHVSQKLVDAMWALEHGAVQIAFVTDDRDRLVGTLTDGDVRRALLQGASLQSPLAPYIQRQFTAVDPSVGRAEVLELMQARMFNQIPIIDVEGRLVGLHLLHELIGRVERANWAVIMAGGKGSRLRPITDHLPKPMVRVAGRPILERIVLHMVGFGIGRVFLSINYLGHIVEEYFGEGERFGCQIDYLRESKPLGTGGPLSLLPKLPSVPLLVMNGDLVTQANLGALLDFHQRGGYQATVAVQRYSHTVPFGCLRLNGQRIVDIEEKPVLSRVVNAGIYVLNPELVARVPREQEFPITLLVEDALQRGESVGAFEILDDWIDVGQRDQLRVAQTGDTEDDGLAPLMELAGNPSSSK